MPPLSQAIQPRDTSDLKLVSGPNPSVLRPNPPLASSADPEFDPRSLAPIPPVLGTDVDASRQFYRQGVSQVRMPPLPPQAKIAIGAAAASQSRQVVSESVVFEVNGRVNPVQQLLNLTGSGVTYGPGPGQVAIGAGTNDGLTHGQTNVSSGGSWETDPAYFVLRDDFSHGIAGSGNGVQLAGIGLLGWQLLGTQPGHDGYGGGLPPNLGEFFWDQSATAKSGAYLQLVMQGTDAGSGGSNQGWALLDSQGWQCTWIFRLGGTAPGIGSTSFPFGQKAMYIGLAGVNATSSWQSGTQGQGRPEVFFGCRYDTSGYYTTGTSFSATAVTQSGSSMALTGTFTNANQTTGTTWVGLWFGVTGSGNGNNNGVFKCTAATPTTLTLTNPLGVTIGTQTITVVGAVPFVLTAAANGNSAQVVYTGTITNGGTNLYVGQMFFVSGFGNAGNNGGPWKCTANSATTITLANPVATGSAETHAGVAGGPVLEDAQFVLEGVVNPSYGIGSPANYTQGTTLATGITPSTGITGWHRLDIYGNAAGQITMTLDGSITLTIPVSKATFTTSVAGLSGNVGGVGTPAEQLNISWTVGGGALPASYWATGSQLTVSGFSGAQAGFNSTFTVFDNGSADGSNIRLLYTPAAPNPITVAAASVLGTLTGYPSLFPACWFGNDNSPTALTSTAMMHVDFFGFVWNPNLGPSAPGTPVATKPRYW